MDVRKVVILFLCLIAANVSQAQSVNVEINSGIYDAALKQTIENNASALLTEINRANRSGANSVNFSGIAITPEAQKSIAMLWDSSPFYCEDRIIVEPVITTYGGGYQIRNIPLEFTPSTHMPKDETNQEAVIDFDKYGKIESFNLAIDNNQYRKIVEQGDKLGDINRRQLILDFIENLKIAYIKKDMQLIEQMFTDSGIVVTNTGKKIVSDDHKKINNKVNPLTVGKMKYLDNLKKVFNNSPLINISIDEIEIFRHPSKPDYYGVSFFMGYKGDSYCDDGYLFLLWDFSKEEEPQIHLKVWEGKDQLQGRKKFSIGDMNFEK